MSLNQKLTFVDTTVTDSTGSGDVIDIGVLHRAAKLRMVVGELEGESVRLAVYTSVDGVLWRERDGCDFVAPGATDLVAVDLDRYVKVVWMLAGPSTTIRVTGTAHQMFATARDLEALSLGPHVIARAESQRVNRALIHGSDVAVGYLSSQYTMPLRSWGDDLAGHTAAVVAYRFMSSIGYDPEGKDSNIRTMYEDAIRWFEKLAEGKMSPAEIVDSAPEVEVGRAIVYTRPTRGW